MITEAHFSFPLFKSRMSVDQFAVTPLSVTSENSKDPQIQIPLQRPRLGQSLQQNKFGQSHDYYETYYLHRYYKDTKSPHHPQLMFQKTRTQKSTCNALVLNKHSDKRYKNERSAQAKHSTLKLNIIRTQHIINCIMLSTTHVMNHDWHDPNL